MSNIQIAPPDDVADFPSPHATRVDTRYRFGWKVEIHYRLDGITVITHPPGSADSCAVDVAASDIEESTAFGLAEFGNLANDGELP